MILNLLDEVDGGDTQKKQLTNPHVELRKYAVNILSKDRDCN